MTEEKQKTEETATPIWLVEVETLSTAFVIVRAETPERAVKWAQGIGAPSDLLDSGPTEFDWPTATTRLLPKGALATGDASELADDGTGETP